LAGVPGEAYQHAVQAGLLRIDWQPSVPNLTLQVYADCRQNPAAPDPDILSPPTLTRQYLVNDGNAGIEVWIPGAAGSEQATFLPKSVIIGNTETWNIYYGSLATVTVTNTFGLRKLASLQIVFASDPGNDDQGKDHDTEMWVYLRDIANGTIASYVESNVTPPALGQTFPQGYAPNTQVARDMLVLAPNTEETAFTGCHLDIGWAPHGGIVSHDLWITNIYLVITWTDGSVTTTQRVNTRLGDQAGNHPPINVVMPSNLRVLAERDHGFERKG
jgi:hypothetical protein